MERKRSVNEGARFIHTRENLGDVAGRAAVVVKSVAITCPQPPTARSIGNDSVAKGRKVSAAWRSFLTTSMRLVIRQSSRVEMLSRRGLPCASFCLSLFQT